jgi:cyclic beta-1,2-glucan synthetase
VSGGARTASLDLSARELAAGHLLADRKPARLPALDHLQRLTPWVKRAREACVEAEAVDAKAAEWLADNEYLVVRAIRQVAEDMPPGFYARLPALSTSGLPRVHAIAHALVESSHLQLSLPTVVRFIDGYQAHTPLTIGELWALPAFLRLVCLEVLVRALLVLRPSLDSPFPVDAPTADGLDETEQIGRAISNLRTIASIPWRDFFCRTSRLEAVLSGDPSGVYAQMDFETRDEYRRTVEDLARRSGRSELEVAERLIGTARDAAADSPRRRHIGYWLIDEGLSALERELHCRVPRSRRLRRWVLRHAGTTYAAAIATTTGAALVVPALYAAASGADARLVLIVIALTMLPASTLSLTFVQWLIVSWLSPRTLPKLDFDSGIPAACRTAVVIPTLITSREDVRRQVERLEMHFVSNPGSGTEFVLLTDFPDASHEHLAGEDAVLRTLVDEIGRLNRKHATQPFHALHRRRQFNPAEGVWMAWERKRGKLEQFNELISGQNATAFSLREGRPDGLDEIRYVVTLDADTILPRGALPKLVGTMAHPLNRPEFDAGSGRVVAGYTVIQPRVEVSPESGTRTWFARWFAGDTAIDIYSRAVSDLYQDLFGAGIYVGKGAYDVRAFTSSLDGRVPENALASHDLFEGIHGRAALATDIVLYEDFPRQYLEYARRLHRWIRGDWQLLPWLWRTVPGRGGRRLRNRLTWIDRWKIADNLRRSLLAPALVVMLAAGWLVFPGHPAVWTALGMLAPAAHIFTDLVTGLARGRRRKAVAAIGARVSDQVGRWALLLLFLPHDALVSLDAIGRTIVRLGITRRHLLQWTSAAHTAALFGGTTARSRAWQTMWISPLFAGVMFWAVSTWRPEALPFASPFLACWVLAPEISIWLGRSRQYRRFSLDRDDRAVLRHVARRTWRYFEVFAGPDDHWLPPDNFQEAPRSDVAHRTSPTNIGMMLLSTLAAHDLGYLGLEELASRLGNSFASLERLDRYRGHLLNWYDTRTLEPLSRQYVSTVDSGNLAVSLLTVRTACRELADGPAIRPEVWDGLDDVVSLVSRSARDVWAGRDVDPLRRRITADISDRLQAVRRTPARWWRQLQEIADGPVAQLDRALTEAGGRESAELDEVREVRAWLERLHHHIRSLQREFDLLGPWLAVLDAAPVSCLSLSQELAAILPPTVRLTDVQARARQVRARLETASDDVCPDAGWRAAMIEALSRAVPAIRTLRADLLAVGKRAEALAMQMDFSLLYDAEARLFHIGYNLSADRLDEHHYDLLASEARLASLFAIAKGDVPVEHWFHLGRPVTRLGGRRGLISWGGSMFEYLMPPLVARSEPGTLLAESERMAVEAQRRYARSKGTPWGTSESGFAETDVDRIYRYRSFGVPTIGFRQGLSDDLVVTPYASVLALAVDPAASIDNIRELESLGLVGAYGLFEAADFTAERLDEGRRFAIVRSYMAHHQGMILAAIDNLLSNDVLVARTLDNPLLRAVSLLLHERVPTELPTESVIVSERTRRAEAARDRHVMPVAPWVPVRCGRFPEMQLIGNGRLSSWISDSGAGALRWRDVQLTRWAADPTCDDMGLWIYIRDEDTGDVWSVTRQPMGAPADAVDVLFAPHAVEFHRRDFGVGVRLEIAVAPGDDVEIRRLTLVNDTDRRRRLTVTTFGEVVLAPAVDHERHPVFSRLFVETVFVRELGGIRCARRSRAPDERSPQLLHWFVSDDGSAELGGFETDRSAFLGRLRSARDGDGTVRSAPASEGFPLDPIVALRVNVNLAAKGTSQLGFATAAAESRDALFDLAERYQTLSSLEWAMTDAQSEAAREIERLRLDPAGLASLQTIGSLLAYRHRAMGCSADAIAVNQLGQPHLWGMGLSGDLPILLVKLQHGEQVGALERLAAGHAIWSRRGLPVDLVVLHEGASGYEEAVGGRLREMLAGLGLRRQLGDRGGMHLLHGDHIGESGRRLLDVAAHVIVKAEGGPLEDQLLHVHEEVAGEPAFVAAHPPDPHTAGPDHVEAPPEALRCFNGLGGFTADGREYVIHLPPGVTTPAPWVNVLANESFGSLVSESGGGYTWAANASEHRLTPWTNDPVSDRAVESCYLRDEETAEVWTITPEPAGAPVLHQVRHGAGYTEWTATSHGFVQVMRVFVVPGDPVKVVRVRLRNLVDRPRRVTATCFIQWALGGARPQGRTFIATEYDAHARAILARNPWTPESAERVAFLTSTREPHGMTADRREFLGREGDPGRPAALGRWGLSGTVESGADPAAALQTHLDIEPRGSAEVIFILGAGETRDHAVALAERYRTAGEVDEAETRLTRFWDERLSVIEVDTPDEAANLMLNHWLLYQAIASRLLARTGFYQSSGAIGFRDQLQDSLALLAIEPSRCRQHLVRCAAHQFEEGDVLHWWHPPLGRGVRTRCTDDLLWLPYAVAEYVETTGDESLLDEVVPFLAARPLGRDENERYSLFEPGDQVGTMLEHCGRAIERGITHGQHGLVLMGAGDWNDGMNRVGRLGRGESVWLSWFAITVMNRFAGLCRLRDADDIAERWTRRAVELSEAVEASAWDGEWYRRAFDDLGRPWGSRENQECQIDAIAQSWSVLSGAGRPDRAARALEAAAHRLIDREHRIVRLLHPPFDTGSRDPGYIKAYPPGIRENGGQYTHAAVWTGWAFADLGDGDRAAAIFDLLNPIGHARDRTAAEHYRVEPYVIAADIGGVAPHLGRGGWTWYTGSAAWMWRFGIERILGLRFRAGKLTIDPCLPSHWSSVHVTIKGAGGTVRLTLDNPDAVARGVAEMQMDGQLVAGNTIQLPADGGDHVVLARLGVEVQTS